MMKIKARLDSVKEELQKEIKKAVDAAESEYRSASKEEKSLKNLLEKQRADVARMQSNAILYNSLKIEIENSRKLLNSLLERQKETLVSSGLGGLKAGNTSIIDRGEIPETPVFPKKKLNLVLALVLGLFGGVGLCFLFEYLDNTIRSPEDIEKLTSISSLGVIPYFTPEGLKKKKRFSRFYTNENRIEHPESTERLQEIKNIELINHLYPKVSISEDYRAVRTSILLSHAEQPPKTLLFTSALPKEGKTASVANMAVSFSQLKKKVLVVDADLRKPQLHKIFDNSSDNRGLSRYLIGKVSLENAIQRTSIENIWLLPSGLIPPNPSELLNSENMKIMIEEVKKIFDIVLIDSPPVLGVIDALIVSSIADSTVVIVNAGKSTRKPFLYTVEELKRAKARIIGVLFNGLKNDSSFMDYYHYYRYRYYQEDENEMKIKNDKNKIINSIKNKLKEHL